MKKPELLAPAGNMESLKAAIAAGCDAIYLGGYMFGARSFAGNFSNEELLKAVEYAHLYNVKVYVTTNTLIYENEVDMFMEYIDFLYHANVDALIIQDLGMMDLIRKTYPDFELHASTQMHIHNLDGVKLVESLGLKRAVLARETPIEIVKEIKEKTNIELEIFIQGALCISYSGQCFMSSFIGNRSGNRGTCAQSCRQKYQLFKKEKNDFIPISKESYLLSTRDLNTLEHIGELIEIGVDSLKIEGRMKRPEYVYFVVSLYRKAIDSYMKNGFVNITEKDIYELKKLFNRTFTKGFLFHEENNHFIHNYRPNHLGIEVGKVIASGKNEISILLNDSVSIQDGIRILQEKEDYGCNLNVFYKNGKIVKEALKGDIITLKVKTFIQKGSKVLKTTDDKQLKEIQDLILNHKRKVKMKATCTIKAGVPMSLFMQAGACEVTVTSDFIPEIAIHQSTTKARVIEQLQKLGNSIYEYESLEVFMEEDLFISIKELNELRRSGIEALNQKRLERVRKGKLTYKIEVPDFPTEKKMVFYAKSESSYLKEKDKNWDMIYLEEPLYSKYKKDGITLKLPRVLIHHPSLEEHVLIGEVGSLNCYQDFDTDFSFHVTNSYTLAFLHSMGAKKVTLSYELTEEQIKELLEGYRHRYHKHPNVELIVSGYLEAMIMKYNVFQDYNIQDSYLYIKDRFSNFYLIENKKDYVIIYNHEKREYKSLEKFYEMGINSLRVEA